MKMNKITRFVSILLASALLAALCACGGSAPAQSAESSAAPAAEPAEPSGAAPAASEPAEAPVENITLTVEASQDVQNNFPFALDQAVFDAFQSANPNITINTILNPDAQVMTVLQTKLAAGQPSDIICYNKVSAENELETMKNFTDLSSEPWVQTLLNPDALRAPDGKIYGFTMQNTSGGYGFVYDATLFESLGLTPPKTWDELLSVCEAIKATGVTPIYGPFKDVYTFQILTSSMWGYYGQKVDPALWDKLNTNQTKWAEIPEILEGLTKGYALYESGYFQDTVLSDEFASIPQVFADKQYAMVIASDAQVKDLADKIPGNEFGLFPIPMYDGESDYITVGQLNAMFHIPTNAQNIDAAKEFINFIAQPEQMNLAQNAQTFVPSVANADPPQFSEFEQHLYDTYFSNGRTVTEMNAYMQVDLNDLWRYYQDMFAGAKTPAEVLQAWDETFAQLMNAKGAPGF